MMSDTGQTTNKLLGVLKSRKFWAAVISILVAFGVTQLNESQESQVVDAILLILTIVVNSVSYQIGTAIEDAARHKSGTSLD